MDTNKINRQKHIKNMTDNLPMLRTRLGLTQEEMAEKSGVSRSTILSIEKNVK